MCDRVPSAGSELLGGEVGEGEARTARASTGPVNDEEIPLSLSDDDEEVGLGAAGEGCSWDKVCCSWGKVGCSWDKVGCSWGKVGCS